MKTKNDFQINFRKKMILAFHEKEISHIPYQMFNILLITWISIEKCTEE